MRFTDPDYRAGYNQGIDDGYTDKPRLWIFFGRSEQYANGYADGFQAGKAHRHYAQSHARMGRVAPACDRCGMQGPWKPEYDGHPDAATGHVTKRTLCDLCVIAYQEEDTTND